MTRVMIVEDDAIIGSDIAETLVRLGYEVPAIADSAEEALREIQARNPDVVLMDIQLRGAIDGVETVTRLRRISDVPVVYLTAHTDEPTLARAKETGPHGYLVKPFNERDLRTSIEVAIRKHELERRVAERERWFSTTLASLGDAVMAADVEGRITFMNPAAEAVTGFTAEAARGLPLRDVFRLSNRSEPAEGSAAGEDVPAALPPNVELVDRAGVRHVLDDTASPIVDERGAVLGRVIVFRDVTERKRLERRLEIAERLASLGTMASGLAHELNNPLAAVMGNVAFALEDLGSLEQEASFGAEALARIEECRAALQDAATAAERLRKIVETMRALVERPPAEKAVVDVRDLVEAALKSTEAALAKKAGVERTYGPAPLVQVDERQFVQVFVDLLTSAADAIVETTPASHEIGVTTATDGDGRAVIEIRHDGASVREADLAHVFEPAYAATAAVKGTGLGLAISHSIVLAAGGELTVHALSGRGAVFRLSLPPAGPGNRAITARALPSRAPAARILVIDDEPAVAKVVARLLPEHDVTVETNSDVALARLGRGERFDVIFCDLMMPGLTGVDVYSAVHSFDPDLASKLVFLTGGTFAPSIAEFLQRTKNRLIQKPFSASELRAAIAELSS